MELEHNNIEIQRYLPVIIINVALRKINYCFTLISQRETNYYTCFRV